jgi:GNAT superfamily N-acetyltransferase
VKAVTQTDAFAVRIAAAGRADFESLRALELAAFATLQAAGAVTGEASAATLDELQTYLDAGMLVAAFLGTEPVGYAGGSIADGDWLHIGEMDVHPDFQRKGIGRRLVQALLLEGRSQKLQGATLTTDRFAPFNAPFYATLGFRIVEKEACTKRLAHILEEEVRQGLDPARRVAMLLDFLP